MADVEFDPKGMTRDAGLRVMPKSVTRNVALTEWARPPLEPVKIRV
jgi:hypothetical protein